MTTKQEAHTIETKGIVLHSAARYYDMLSWWMTRGRERAFRERLVDLAGIEPGEAVLDIGCGTGSLALAAKQRVGARGEVNGIDASPEMIGKARRKAVKAGATVVFETGVAETLPFPEARFDVVLSTLMLHHLPRPARQQCLREARRVSRPGGRLLVVDFESSSRQERGLLGRMHRHGGVSLDEIVQLVVDAGFRVVRKGPVGLRNLQFVLAASPTDV